SQQATNDDRREGCEPMRQVRQRSLVSGNKHTFRQHKQQKLQYKIKLKENGARSADFGIVSARSYLVCQSKEYKRNQRQGDEFVRVAVKYDLIRSVVEIGRCCGVVERVMMQHVRIYGNGQQCRGCKQENAVPRKPFGC